MEHRTNIKIRTIITIPDQVKIIVCQLNSGYTYGLMTVVRQTCIWFMFKHQLNMTDILSIGLNTDSTESTLLTIWFKSSIHCNTRICANCNSQQVDLDIVNSCNLQTITYHISHVKTIKHGVEHKCLWQSLYSCYSPLHRWPWDQKFDLGYHWPWVFGL